MYFRFQTNMTGEILVNISLVEIVFSTAAYDSVSYVKTLILLQQIFLSKCIVVANNSSFLRYVVGITGGCDRLFLKRRD